MSSAVLRLLVLLVVVTLLGTGVPRVVSGIASEPAAPDHLVISEVVTGGASASDELIELYNPTAGPMPLEGLELVYASASGLTVSRRAAWELGAIEMPPGGHLLVAHELGVYAPIADVTYASGIAATGGSIAVRIVGASSAIDAVGWGSAAGALLEGSAAEAPPAGSSLERLPGGALGSTQDTDANAVDFVARPVPRPENSASPPVPQPSSSGTSQPSASPTASATVDSTPTPTPLPEATPASSPAASPTPGGEVVPIAAARAVLDGTRVTIEGVALTGSDFADGGGYVADESGGLAVLVSGGSFARGDRLRLSGEIDDRYAQRTLRADDPDVVLLGTGSDPEPIEVSTGGVGEDVEGRLVRMSGTVAGAPTALSGGLAFDVDDGSGPVRLLVGTATGIDVSGWGAGFAVDAIGVVGQRDSTGTGASGYRVQPRDAVDILAAGPGPSPSASPGASPTSEATPAPSQAADLISVASARRVAKGASAVVRGVVTLAPGLVDPATAVLQDASGAIVLRVGDEAGPFVRGTLLEVHGVRSTLSGMETLRVTTPPRSLGAGADPGARAVRTGEAGETHEAILVVVRGALVGNPRRSAAGTVSFEIDDGSGPLRISVGSSAGIASTRLATDTWIEVRGVLGQETTGSLPLRGYRVWPRDATDLRVMAPLTPAAASDGGSARGGTGSAARTPVSLASLDAVGGAAGAGMPIGATLVVGRWEELGLGGLLWDGVRLVGIHADAAPLVAGVLGSGRLPVALQANGLRVVDVDRSIGVPVADIADEPGALVPSGLPPSAPLTAPGLGGGEARWVTVVGTLDRRQRAPALTVDGASLLVEHRCEREPMPRRSTVSVMGILVGEPSRLVVPCGGIVPAPLLARATAQGEVTEPLTPAGGATVNGPESPSGSLPAVLLLLAATTLAAGAAAARWGSSDGTPAPDAGPVAPEEVEEATSPPNLTLVPMPRERAP